MYVTGDIGWIRLARGSGEEKGNASIVGVNLHSVTIPKEALSELINNTCLGIGRL